MILWICGRFTDSKPWEVLGVYSSEDAAINRCTKQIDFVAPLELDEDLPEECIEWPGCYYPLAEIT